MAPTGPMDEFDEQYEVFCDLADTQGSARAAGSLGASGSPRRPSKATVDRFERHKGAVRGMAPAHVRSGGRFTGTPAPAPGTGVAAYFEEMLRGRGWEEGNRRLDEASTGIVGLLDHPATPEFSTRGLVLGSRPVGQDVELHRRHGQGGRPRLQALHRPRRHPQRTTPPDPEPSPSGSCTGRTRSSGNRSPRPTTTSSAPPPARRATSGGSASSACSRSSRRIPRFCASSSGWLHDAETQLRDIPALVIDDEADQAGVATKTINPLILQLLGTLPRVGYVGYTATPFANLLIDPGAGDLYPRHFIVDLPKPDGHFGTEVIFGGSRSITRTPSRWTTAWTWCGSCLREEVPLVRPGSQRRSRGVHTPDRG